MKWITPFRLGASQVISGCRAAPACVSVSMLLRGDVDHLPVVHHPMSAVVRDRRTSEARNISPLPIPITTD
jgi:hypothetical protein